MKILSFSSRWRFDDNKANTPYPRAAISFKFLFPSINAILPNTVMQFLTRRLQSRELIDKSHAKIAIKRCNPPSFPENRNLRVFVQGQMEVFTMEINVTMEGDAVTIGLVGRLDTITSPALQQKTDEIMKSSSKIVMTVDFMSVDFVSSAGLRVLLMLHKKLNASQGSLSLRNLSVSVKEVFDMTGFSSILKIN
jgi:anti-anti-sigma factor